MLWFKKRMIGVHRLYPHADHPAALSVFSIIFHITEAIENVRPWIVLSTSGTAIRHGMEHPIHIANERRIKIDLQKTRQ
jgi:hypothetical protein